MKKIFTYVIVSSMISLGIYCLVTAGVYAFGDKHVKTEQISMR